jgi:hypothetical protein
MARLNGSFSSKNDFPETANASVIQHAFRKIARWERGRDEEMLRAGRLKPSSPFPFSSSLELAV